MEEITEKLPAAAMLTISGLLRITEMSQWSSVLKELVIQEAEFQARTLETAQGLIV